MHSNHPPRTREFEIARPAATATVFRDCMSQSKILDARMSQTGAPAPLALGCRRELFIDEHLIAKLSHHASRRLHHPQPREIVLRHDAPWEGTGSGYHSLFHDGDRYRLYYKAFDIRLQAGQIVDEVAAHRFTCYAESPDGVHWTKPELGLVEFQGSRANNIVVASGPHGALAVDAAHPAVFRDDNPAAPPAARYKAVFRSDREVGLVALQSPDGLRWSPLGDRPLLTDGAFDSQNLLFWDAARGHYRAYWRCFPGGVVKTGVWQPQGARAIRTATSTDLTQWTKSEDLTYAGSPPAEELYTSQIKPYHRAPHLFIGFPARYVERPWGPALRALPDREHREQRSRSQPRYGEALTESLLMCSRDGVHFTRWAEAFLRPGPEHSGTWSYGQQYLAWHLVETASPLGPDAPPELSLYAVENYWLGSGSVVRRHALRLDGFVSLHAPMAGGEMLTHPLTFSGRELRLNFATSAAGDVRVEVQTAAGIPVPGHGLDDCEPLFGDAVDRVVHWRQGPEVAALAGQTVRLRFVLRDADVYALRFA